MKHPIFLIEMTEREEDQTTVDDYNQKFVISAKNPQKARQLAAAQKRDESAEVWLDPKRTTCVRLAKMGPYAQEMVLCNEASYYK